MQSSAQKAPIVLMVSGGADSVALLLKAVREPLDIADGQGANFLSKNRLHVLHVNHQLRGDDALHDECFVEDLCLKLGVACTVMREDVAALAQELDGNIEGAGRTIRYQRAHELLSQLCAESGCSFEDGCILTAHSASDRAETFMMNVIRGTGLSGLSSIQVKTGVIVRPLLGYTHEELEEYVASCGMNWCEDATNKDTNYLRSYVRYKVIPALKTRNPKVVEALFATCNILSEDDSFIEEQAQRVYEQTLSGSYNDARYFDSKTLASVHKALRARIYRRAILSLIDDARIEYDHIQTCEAVLEGILESASLCAGIQVRSRYGQLWFMCKVPITPDIELSLPGSVSWNGHEISAELVSVSKTQDVQKLAREIAALNNAYLVAFDEMPKYLTVGSLRVGDTMQPFGMGGHSQKVADMLSHHKIPVELKGAVPIVRTPDNAIVLVAGIRSDERFKCRKNSQVFIKLSIPA